MCKKIVIDLDGGNIIYLVEFISGFRVIPI